ncbi:hypothetical protein [Paratractidigestivibacter sp.]|uniref:hypothetical protein n=1 Tax=Paratractidigestivibacter sp. TaxID=2847316 RepID=UPI002AC95A5B|nr:hypothetical protein [Paratractidigestivibacter sp.]
MGLFKSVFNSDGTVSVEHTIGNMRYDLMKPGEGPSAVVGHIGNMATVIKPGGQVVQELQIGNTRFSTGQNIPGQNGFSTLF